MKKMLLSKHGRSLRFASPNLQNDRDIVLAAVSQNGCALRFASVTLQDNHDIIALKTCKNFNIN